MQEYNFERELKNITKGLSGELRKAFLAYIKPAIVFIKKNKRLYKNWPLAPVVLPVLKAFFHRSIVPYIATIARANKPTGVIAKPSYTLKPTVDPNTQELELRIDTKPVTMQRHSLSIKFSPEFITDIQNLYGKGAIDEIAEMFVNILLNSIDADAISKIKSVAQTVEAVSLNPPPGFMGGPKMWFENVYQSVINAIGKIYGQTNIPFDIANILVNPTVPIANMQVRRKQVRMLLSPMIPPNEIYVVPKNYDARAAICVWFLYMPPTLVPLPRGNQISFTIMYRGSFEILRPEAIAKVELS